MSEREAERNDVVCQKRGPHSPAAGSRTIVRLDHEFVSERIPSFLSEIAEKCLRVSRLGDRRTASDLASAFTHIPEETDVLQRSIIGHADCKEIFAR